MVHGSSALILQHAMEATSIHAKNIPSPKTRSRHTTIGGAGHENLLCQVQSACLGSAILVILANQEVEGSQ